MHVGADAALGPEVARHHRDRVVRSMTNLAEVRIRLVGRIAVIAVVGALAALIVLVDPRAGEPVEPLHRCGRRFGRQTRLGGPFLQRVGRDDDAGFQPLPRNALARIQTRKNVAVAVLLVEYQPGRDVLARASALPVLAAVRVVARLDVRHRLVHEPLTRRVDTYPSC